MMLKKVLFFALASIIVHKIYRYYKFMGYSRSGQLVAEYEPTGCSRKYRNLNESTTSVNDRRKILNIHNTLDSDVLPNGICMFSSGQFYPFYQQRLQRSTNQSLVKLLRQDDDDARRDLRASIYMLDMNYLEQLKPVAVDIVDAETRQPKSPHLFNLYAMSIYQDEMQNFKLVAANFDSSTQSTRIEKFSYDLNR